MDDLEFPLFPLNTVLFPGGYLPLRIFEPRYVDMISNCMRTDTGFGISLIKEGSEVGKAAKTYPVGTLVSIHNWDKRDDGLLGIVVHGTERFRIHSTHVQTNQLTMATAELIPNEPRQPIPSRHMMLIEILQGVMSHLDRSFAGDGDEDFDDASWVGSRLAEVLPIELRQKQFMLQMNSPLQRLDHLSELLRDMQIR